MIELRPGRAFDAAACAQIVNDWIDATPWLPRVRTPGEIAWHYRETVFRKRNVIVAEVRREVAGFLTIDTDLAEVTSLYAAAPGHGVGAALLGAAKAAHPRLSLWTFQANTGARRFYLREGMTEGRRTEDENEEHLPDIEFLWQRPG